MHKITITFEIIKINNSISMGKSKERVGGREETNQRDLPVQTKNIQDSADVNNWAL